MKPFSFWAVKMEKRYIVLGPVGGLYYVGYKVPGTNVYQPVEEFTSEQAAQAECRIKNGEGDDHGR